MTVLLALVLLSAADVHERATPMLRCREVCERYASQTGFGPGPCNRCVTGGGTDRAAWIFELDSDQRAHKALLAAQRDEDWAVSWAATRVLARRDLRAEKSVLATWVMRATSKEVLPACLTAARVAGSLRLSTAELLAHAGADGPRAAARVWEHRGEIKRTLEVELYAQNAEVRREALFHLSAFLGRPSGRIILDAMASRPLGSDEIAAGLLEEDCARSGTTIEKALIRNAKPEDQPLVNRLLAVYARRLDTLRDKLRSNEVNERKEAIEALRRLAPISTAELKTALEDSNTGVQMTAARALAAAEGRSLPEHVKAISAGWSANGGSAAEDVQVRWVQLLGRSQEKGCAPVLGGIAQAAHLGGPVRAAAFEAISTCSEKDALKLLSSALKDESPELRAAAVRALGSLPRQRGAEDAAGEALKDSSSEVVASALAVVASQGQGRRTAEVAGLLTHRSPDVRMAAVRALSRLPKGEAFAKEVSRRLREDESPGVRGAAVQTLAAMGGPEAMSALTAATQDPDGRVQYLAKDSLRRLGFRR